MTILSLEMDGLQFYYGWYKDDNRQINVRLEGQQWIAYVGGEKVGALASKDEAEAAAIRFIEANPVGGKRMTETAEALEQRLRGELPFYARAERIHTKMMLAGDDGSWAGETDVAKVMVYATAILAEELEVFAKNPTEGNEE